MRYGVVLSGYSEADIEKAVIHAVAEGLELEPSEVQLEQGLFGDLGAESLDLLDIAFNLERRFGIQLPRADVLQRASDHFGSDSLIKDGVLTEFSLSLFAKSMPEIDAAQFKPGLTPMDAANLITVASFVRLVMRLLREKECPPERCPKCGDGPLIAVAAHAEWECGACQEKIAMPDADEILMKDMIELQGEVH